jgi:hypothetical protein
MSLFRNFSGSESQCLIARLALNGSYLGCLGDGEPSNCLRPEIHSLKNTYEPSCFFRIQLIFDSYLSQP